MSIQFRSHLWKLLKSRDNHIAEIGVAEGRFSLEIMQWPIHVKKLYLVDRWKHAPFRGDSSMPATWHQSNLEQVRQKMEIYGERVVILQGESVEMANHVPPQSLDLIHIDADHSYEGVKLDINAWYGRLKPGGIMSFHDYENPQYGVKRAVEEFTSRIKMVPVLLPESKPEDAGAYFYRPVC